MALYTYEQFEKAARDSGMYDQFSAADLALAKSNPDAGMSILTYKQDYANATTDEARALANAGAERIRSDYGNYTAGKDGSGYVIDPMSPSSFEYAAAPSYSSRYDASMQQLLNGITNRQEFSYDATTDPLAAQYRKTYAREGQRATQDALGAAAAATGGMPSSYAVTAAGQAGNYYAAQMADKIPELYEMAYNRYLNEFNMDLSSLGALQSAEQLDYDKYLTQLGQYNADRSFNYGVFMDDLAARDAAQNAAFEKALYAAQYGDYSFLNDMGINTDNNPEDWERQYNMAILGAQYGDMSGLENLGIVNPTNPDDWERQYNLAILAAEYGDYSGLKALGIDVSALEAAGVVGSGDDVNTGDNTEDASPAGIPAPGKTYAEANSDYIERNIARMQANGASRLQMVQFLMRNGLSEEEAYTYLS